MMRSARRAALSALLATMTVGGLPAIPGLPGVAVAVAASAPNPELRLSHGAPLPAPTSPPYTGPDPAFTEPPASKPEAVPPGVSFEPRRGLPDGDASAAADAKGRVSGAPASSAPTTARLAAPLTATERTVVGPDGHLGLDARARPTRKRNAKTKQWEELDGTITVRSDGRLAPRVPLTDVSFASDASLGPVATVKSASGTFSISHPHARRSAASARGARLHYDNAFTNGSALVEQPGLYGFEESVIVPSRAAGNFYDATITMPAGVRARQAGTNIEFVSGSTVVATFGNGWALDSRTTGAGPAETPASMTLASQNANVVSVRVTVPPAWFDDPARVFPVTIDPDWSESHSAGEPGGGDTYIDSSDMNSHWGSQELRVGKIPGYNIADRVQLKFPLGAMPNNHVRVSKADLTFYNYWSSVCGLSSETAVNVYANASWPGPGATWNNQPGYWAIPGQPQGNWTGRTDHTGDACAAGLRAVDVTPLARAWIQQGRMANNGLSLIAANENVDASWKKFYSAETFLPPSLHVDYDYYDAEYGAARSWTRPAGQPFDVGVWVHNKTFSDWNAFRYQLHAYTKVNGQPKRVGTGLIAANTVIKAGGWYRFDVKMNALPVGAAGVEFTMADMSVANNFGEFWWWGTAPGGGVLDIAPTSALGVPAYTTLDGGFVNPYNGNFHYENTDLSVPSVGPELKLTRAYNSEDSHVGWFGPGWTSTYETHLEWTSMANVTLVHPDGRREMYTFAGGYGVWVAPPGYTGIISERNGVTTLKDKKNTTFTFSHTNPTYGALTSITDEHGDKITLSLGNDNHVDRATLSATNKNLYFKWDAGRTRIISVSTDSVVPSDPSTALTWTYNYNGGKLMTACDPRPIANHCISYAVSQPQITWINNPSGKQLVAIDYDTTGVPGRVKTRRDGMGNATSYTYSVHGSGLTATYWAGIYDANGRKTNYAYNPDGQIVFIWDPTGRFKWFTYDTDDATNHDPKGFLTKVALLDANKKEAEAVTYKRDSNGNVTQQTDALGNTEYAAYDTDNHLRASSDGRSDNALDPTYMTSYIYDSGGRLLKKTYPKPGNFTVAPFEQWSYTDGNDAAVDGGLAPKGLLQAARDRNGNVTRYGWSHRGVVKQITKPNGFVVNYEYDGYLRRTTETERCSNCNVTDALTTTTTYDGLSNPINIVEPAFDDTAAGGVVHQRMTHNVYDDDENLAESDVSDIGGSSKPDPTRVTRHAYDNNGVETITTAPDGGQTIKTLDKVGNVLTVQDPNGNVTRTSYDVVNRPFKVELLGYQDDPVTNTAPYDLTLSTTGYDAYGRKTDETLTSGRHTKFAYDAAGRLTTTTVLDFFGPGQNFVAEKNEYDGAGNVTKTTTGNGQLLVSRIYDVMGRVIQNREDPFGRNRSTDDQLDGNGNVIVRKIGDSNYTHPYAARTDYTYDREDHVLTATLENSPGPAFVTTYTYDQRGNKISASDPRLQTTNYTYDGADHLVATQLPAVTATTAATDGTTTALFNIRPTSSNAYDTFDQVVRATDANGNATTTQFDIPGRTRAVTYPTYTPADGSTPITPTEQWAYDANGNVLRHTDRAGQSTMFAYTRRSQVSLQTDPRVAGASTPGTVHTIYDPAGRKTQVLDQNNHSTSWSYDQLDRATSMTKDVFAGGSWRHDTTTYGYDGLDKQTSITTPLGKTTTQVWTALGEVKTTTVALEDSTTATTTYGYDRIGHQTQITEPGSRVTKNVYDMAGRLTSTGQYADNQPATQPTTLVANGYDADGNRISATTLRGAPQNYSTTYGYDAANRLTSVTKPVDAQTAITTTYGYDPAGNLTESVQPKTTTWNESTALRYNAWNLPDMVIEPLVGGETIGDRTYRTVYDAAGRSVLDLGPGGVTVLSAFDELGRLKSQQASGGGGANATKSFGYDLVGNVTSASAPGSALQFGYDERNLLTSAAGLAGAASLTYNADAELASRTDAAGTATFSWTKRGQLKSLNDPLTGTTLTNSWNADGRLATTALSSGAHRDYTYDAAGRPASDTLTSAANAVTASTAYTYDGDGNLATKIVGPAGVAGAGTNTYGYDRANRLTSWTAPNNSTTAYGYDLAGNRTQAGTKTFTYDNRNRVVGDSTGKTYVWSTAGWLTNNAGTAVSYDAFGRPVNSDGVTYSYDALDRVAARNGQGFVYSAKDPDPISDGTFSVTHSPAGGPVAYRDSTGAHIALTDQHTDVTALANTDGTVAQSTSYNPFGEPTATVGTAPRVGYQSNYTDPTSKQSKMGARWYAPGLDSFTTRDSYGGEATNPISTNGYTYGADNPLRYTDPTGHSIMDGLASAMNNFARIARQQEQIELFMAGRAVEMRELMRSAGATGKDLDYYSPKNFPRMAPVAVLDSFKPATVKPQTAPPLMIVPRITQRDVLPVDGSGGVDSLSHLDYLATRDSGLAARTLSATYEWCQFGGRYSDETIRTVCAQLHKIATKGEKTGFAALWQGVKDFAYRLVVKPFKDCFSGVGKNATQAWADGTNKRVLVGCAEAALLVAPAVAKGAKALDIIRAADVSAAEFDAARVLKVATESVPEVPAYAGLKTSGTLVRPDGSAVDLISGLDGPALQLPKPRPGMNGNIVGHVEAHAAAIMRTEGLEHATLWINRAPCGGFNGCAVNLSRMVPKGSTMTINVMEGGTAGSFDDMIIVTGTG